LKPGEKFKHPNTGQYFTVESFDGPEGRVWVVPVQSPFEDPRCKEWFCGQLKVEINKEVLDRMRKDTKPIPEATRSKIRLQNLEEGDCYRVQTREDGVNWKTIFEGSDFKTAEAVYNWNRSILLYNEDSWRTEYEE
jgi:hypothetical protein